MFKAMILLKRCEGASVEQFQNWWLNEHQPLARQLPNVKRVVFNVVGNEDADYDGVSELWFENEADFAAAYASEIGQIVAADSMQNVSQRIRLIVTEHVVKA